MPLKRKPLEGNVRNVPVKGLNLRGIITNKADRSVQFGSWAARTLMLRLDRDQTVKDYISQPERFKYLDNRGKQQEFIPELKVFKSNGNVELHQIVYSKSQESPNIKLRDDRMREICKARGWLYVIHSEVTLPKGAELANLLALYAYRPKVYANPLVDKQVALYLDAGIKMPMTSLITKIATGLSLAKPEVITALGHLIWHNQLCIDMDKLLFIESSIASGVQVWLPGKENSK